VFRIRRALKTIRGTIWLNREKLRNHGLNKMTFRKYFGALYGQLKAGKILFACVRYTTFFLRVSIFIKSKKNV